MEKSFLLTVTSFISLSMGWAADAPKRSTQLDLSIPADSKYLTATPEPLPITKVFQIAYENDSRLEASRRELEASQYRFEADYARAWGPQLAITAGMVYGKRWITPQPIFGNFNGWTLSGGLTLIQPIFDYVRIIQADQSNFAESVSEVRNAIAQQDLIVRVTKAYLDVLRVKELIKIKEDEIAATKIHLEIVQEQVEVGLATQVDLDEAQSKVAVARAQKQDLEAALINHYGVLSQTWGLEGVELKQLKSKIKFEAPTPADPQKWIDQALSFNLTVQYTRGLMEISQYDIEKARAQLNYPVIDFRAGCSAQGTAEAPFGDNLTSTDACSAGFNLSIPIFDGGFTPAKTKELSKIKEKIREDVRTSQISAAQSARISFASISKELANIELYQRSVKNASEALEGKREQYLNGERTSFEVLTTLQTLNQYKQQLIEEKYGFLYNRILLKEAVGILSILDLEQIDALLE